MESCDVLLQLLQPFYGSRDYRVAQKKPHTILLSISLLNIDRFS